MYDSTTGASTSYAVCEMCDLRKHHEMNRKLNTELHVFNFQYTLRLLKHLGYCKPPKLSALNILVPLVWNMLALLNCSYKNI